MTYLLHRPSGLSLKKVASYFCKQSGPRSGPTLKGRAWSASEQRQFWWCSWENFSKNIFYANSLNQINNVWLRSSSTPCADPNGGGGGGGGGEGIRRTPSKISQKYSFFSNWSGPLKITKLHFLCMTNIHTLAKRNLNGVSLAGRWWPAYSYIWILSPLIKFKKTCKSLTPSDKIFWIRACKQCHVWSGSKLFDTDDMIRWVFSISQ